MIKTNKKRQRKPESPYVYQLTRILQFNLSSRRKLQIQIASQMTYNEYLKDNNKLNKLFRKIKKGILRTHFMCTVLQSHQNKLETLQENYKPTFFQT